jgi:hypothetical protein
MDNRKRWWRLFFGAGLLLLVCLAPAHTWPARPAEAFDQPAADPGTAADPVLSASSLQQRLNQLFETQSQQLDRLQARLDLVDQDLQALPNANIVKFVAGRSSYYTGDTLNAMDAAPLISDGRLLVPVRYLADALGAQTDWDGKSDKMTISEGGTVVELTIGSDTITVNSRQEKMDVAPFISQGRTYLPARYVAESLGCTVLWDAGTQTVTVTH